MSVNMEAHFLGRLPKVDLIILEGGKCPSVRFDRAGFLIFVLVFVSRDSELDQNLSGDFQKNFSSHLDEIWYVGRGR